MNLRSLAAGLDYVDSVTGKKQTYHVFEAKKVYFVLSFSRTKPNSGNFNLVPKDAVAHLRRAFAGRQNVTARQITVRSRKRGYLKNPLQALNALYVLVATGAATRDDRYKDRELHFNVHPRS